jgi:hypothetical protein
VPMLALTSAGRDSCVKLDSHATAPDASAASAVLLPRTLPVLTSSTSRATCSDQQVSLCITL